MTDTKPNAELAYRVLDHIKAHPEQHDQHVWVARAESDCGTAACFAGWTCLLAGDRAEFEDDFDNETSEVACRDGGDWGGYEFIPYRAARLLRIQPDDGPEGVGGFRLFSVGNSREDLGRLVAEIFGPRPAVAA